jgi:hypothetical protein
VPLPLRGERSRLFFSVLELADAFNYLTEDVIILRHYIVTTDLGFEGTESLRSTVSSILTLISGQSNVHVHVRHGRRRHAISGKSESHKLSTYSFVYIPHPHLLEFIVTHVRKRMS